MALAVAVVGGLVGGLSTQLIAFVFERYSRHDRWLDPLRLAAADLIAHYGLQRGALVRSVRSENLTVPPEDEFFAISAPLVAKLMTLPGTEPLVAPRRALSRSIRMAAPLRLSR